ncbi:hypothetical protein CWE09_02410 [Aliidiomarina minuta]|uniref:Chalcone isomerase domain-containing protein n=1 Tax=Aliidiomarina minuta TaxID=880057 RepID=A0A432W6A2_9GAMM|nr:chalcone isomerase family protein [Aliidiomarina minuta]RUO25603.1 hypothetical protein CWE09_02410 [Aliidiomarina minuta]
MTGLKMVAAALVFAGGLGAFPAYASQCTPEVTQELTKIGSTRLRVMLFRVYDAELMTDSGRYPEAEQVALRLDYLRSIKADTLVDTTEDEWEKLGYSIGDNERQWLSELRDMWPDVKSGDCLVAYHENGAGIRFYSADGELGKIASNAFATQFFAIWLDENSSYRRNRDELLGER